MTAVLEMLLSSVLDCTVDAVLMTDDDGMIVYVNSSLMRLFGFTDDADSPVGMSIGSLLPDADEMDVEGCRVDGSFFPVDVQVRVLPDAPFVVATVRDMTEQRQSVVDNAIDRIDLANAKVRDRAVAGVARLGDPAAVRARHLHHGKRVERDGADESDGHGRASLDDIINAVQRDRQ